LNITNLYQTTTFFTLIILIILKPIKIKLIVTNSMVKSYAEANIQAAILLHQTTEINIAECGRRNGVPRETLSQRINGKHGPRQDRTKLCSIVES
jgi:hypothetical protein